MLGPRKPLSITWSVCAQNAKKSKSTAIANVHFQLVARASKGGPAFPANKVRNRKRTCIPEIRSLECIWAVEKICTWAGLSRIGFCYFARRGLQ